MLPAKNFFIFYLPFWKIVYLGPLMMNKVKVPMGHKIVSEAGMCVLTLTAIRFVFDRLELKYILIGRIHSQCFIYIYVCMYLPKRWHINFIMSRLFHVVHLTV